MNYADICRYVTSHKVIIQKIAGSSLQFFISGCRLTILVNFSISFFSGPCQSIFHGAFLACCGIGLEVRRSVKFITGIKIIDNWNEWTSLGCFLGSFLPITLANVGILWRRIDTPCLAIFVDMVCISDGG